MDLGDWVVVPSWGVFSVYRVKGPACPIQDLPANGLKNWHGQAVEKGEWLLTCPREEGPREYDLGFYLEVEPIKVDIARREYADAALTSRLKYRGTTHDSSDLYENVVAAMDAAGRNEPIHLHSQILEVSQSRVLKLLQEQLNPDKLEALIKWYFETSGASEVEIPPKNEAGKQGDGDIVATFETLRTIYYVQAKHHSGFTDEWAIEQIASYTENRQENLTDDGYTQIAWVISTAERFSKEAEKLAKQKNVQLFDGSDLAAMILDAGIGSLDALDL